MHNRGVKIMSEIRRKYARAWRIRAASRELREIRGILSVLMRLQLKDGRPPFQWLH